MRRSIFPPVKHIAKFFTPQRSAKIPFARRNLKPAVGHPGLVNRTRYDGIEFAAARQRYGFFKCRRCGAAVSTVGSPNEQSGYFPMMLYSAADRADVLTSSASSNNLPVRCRRSRRACDADARLHRTWLHAIAHDLSKRIRACIDGNRTCELRTSERPDVSLGAQTGDPAFLQALRFQLDQFLLDFGPQLQRAIASCRRACPRL